MNDYTALADLVSLLFFAAMFSGAVYLCFRSYRAGYFDSEGEQCKHRMLKDE